MALTDRFDAAPEEVEEAMCRILARCVYCGDRAPRVVVHGHEQCATCGVNVEPCCGGGGCG
jgi:hypothetical protein